MTDDLIENMIEQLARLPGLGPRSARRAALHLLQKRSDSLAPLANSLNLLVDKIVSCVNCGNISTNTICTICTICSNPKRAKNAICVVEQVSDLWAIERAGFFSGQYHVLNGVLSPFDGKGPNELRLPFLQTRAQEMQVDEIILAISATIDGQSTAHYISDLFQNSMIKVTVLAKGVPLGSELDYLDEGTIETAFRARQ